jgi:hypothetical protein
LAAAPPKNPGIKKLSCGKINLPPMPTSTSPSKTLRLAKSILPVTDLLFGSENDLSGEEKTHDLLP